MQRVMMTSVMMISLSVAAFAVDVPFTETFAGGPSGWTNFNNSVPADWFATGGVADSAYASGAYNFVNNVDGDTPIILRGQGSNNASGGAFVGNWLAEGVTAYSFAVRHDAPVPLNFFTRFATPMNFPGAIGVGFAPVLPNTWTEIVIPIDPSNPQFVSFEGSDFNTIFSNIGNIQIGANVPAALAGVDASYTFDIDNVSIVPEPASALLLVLGGVALRRRG